MQEPIVLGLGAQATDEELEARAAGIRQRAEAFVAELTEVSRKHNVWLDGVEETPQLMDGQTEERAGNCDRGGSGYSASFSYDVSSPVEFRRGVIERRAEQRARQEQYEQEAAEQQRRQTEEAERMTAAGYQRLDYSHMAGLGMQYMSGGTIIAVGTAGAWYNPKTGDVTTGGTPDPKEYRP